MTKRFRDWLSRKWSRQPDSTLPEAYRVTFSTLDGQRVLQHLLDSVYCTCYEGTDAVGLAQHEGARRVVHEILVNVDLGEQPQKYDTHIVTEANYGGWGKSGG